ncbi:MAG: pyridoxamine 5'-phosphate oxidase family protein [Candidatus Aureabacteria bacterium]|nr:pyridoxamine 5'-phosphate oxidase family protein [Candidatus Auribacterota bacterium]
MRGYVLFTKKVSLGEKEGDPMKRLSDEIVRFFNKQHYVIVTTVGSDGKPHSACKGVVKISRAGEIYLLDLYRGITSRNLEKNPRLSVTVVDEHRFKGYCLKGTGRIVKLEEVRPSLLRAWERRLSSRITHRIIKNIRGEKGHPRHPEALLPGPKYLIAVEVSEVIDLTPAHIG